MKIQLDFVAWKEHNTTEIPNQPIQIAVFAGNDGSREICNIHLEDALFSVMRSELRHHRKLNPDTNDKIWMHAEDYANAMSIALELRRLSDEYMKFVADNYTTKSKWDK